MKQRAVYLLTALCLVAASANAQTKQIVCAINVNGTVESIPFTVLGSQKVNCKQLGIQNHDKIVLWLQQRDYAQRATMYTAATTNKRVTRTSRTAHKTKREGHDARVDQPA